MRHEEGGEAGLADDYLVLLLVFVAGWTLMTVAMMLPTSLPLPDEPEVAGLLAPSISSRMRSMGAQTEMTLAKGHQGRDRRGTTRQERYKLNEALEAESHLLGRVTYAS